MTNDLTVNIARNFSNEVLTDYESIAAFLEAIDYTNILQKNLVGLSLPNQPKITGEFRVGEGSPSYTDGKKVMVGFNEFFLNQPQTRIMAFEMALRLHEVFHIYYTDFQSFITFQRNIMNNLASEFEGTSKEQLARQVGQFVAVGIFNGIEDGRIEFKGAFDVPGYRVVGDGFRAVWWEQQEVDTQNPNQELSNYIFALVTYATMRVLPKGFYNYPKTHRIFKELAKVKHLVEYASRANTTKDFEKYAYEIYQVMKEYVVTLIKEHTPDIQQQEVDFENTKAQKERGEQGEQEGQQQQPGNPLDNNATKQKQVQEKEGSGDKSVAKEDENGEGNQKEQSDGNGGSSEKENSNEESADSADNTNNNAADFNEEEDLKKINERLEKLKEKEDGEISQLIEDAFRKFRKEERKYQKEDNLNKQQEEVALEEYQANGGDLNSILYLNPNRKDFQKDKMPSTIRREGKKLERFFKDVLEARQSKKRFNLERGRINTRRLTALKTGNRHVFMQEKQRSLVTTAGYILLDGSGSMYGGKYNTSIHAASIVEQGLKNLIPLKIAQFSTDFSNSIHKNVKDFEDPLKKDFLWELKHDYLQPGGGNADGISLRIAIEELKKRQETDKILVVVSDGLPSHYESTEQGINDVREVVKKAKQDGIKVISIFIAEDNEELPPVYVEQFRYMYGESSVIATPKTFTKEIIKVFKRFIK